MLYKENSDWVLKSASVTMLTAATPPQSLPLCAALPYASQTKWKEEKGTGGRDRGESEECKQSEAMLALRKTRGAVRKKKRFCLNSLG